MAFTKLQSGHWLVSGRCSEPRFNYVGGEQTPKCTIGIAAGRNKDEKDEKGYPKTIWINLVAWRDDAYRLYQAQKGDEVLATGLLHEHEWEGRTYRDINVDFVIVSKLVDPYANTAPHTPAPAASSAPDWTELAEDDDGELPF